MRIYITSYFLGEGNHLGTWKRGMLDNGYIFSNELIIVSLLHHTAVPLVDSTLFPSRKLLDSLDACTSELVELQRRLDPRKSRKAIADRQGIDCGSLRCSCGLQCSCFPHEVCHGHISSHPRVSSLLVAFVVVCSYVEIVDDRIVHLHPREEQHIAARVVRRYEAA